MTPDPQPDRGERRWTLGRLEGATSMLEASQDFDRQGLIEILREVASDLDQALARVEEAQKLADDQHRMAGEIHTQLEEARERAEKAEQTIAAVREAVAETLCDDVPCSRCDHLRAALDPLRGEGETDG